VAAAAPERPPPVLSRDRLAADTLVAARAILGARLVRDPGDGAAERRVGRIVEVEAYIGEGDRASHARMGPTPRNRVMFGPAGIAYVYLVYGMHHCLNVVTGPDGYPAAVLLRSAVPVDGAPSMRTARLERAMASRRADRDDPAAAAARLAGVPDARLALGPARLAAAFGVERRHDGIDLLDPSSPIRLEPGAADDLAGSVEATPRIGVDYAGPEWASRPWRFVLVPEADRSGGAERAR